MSRGVGEHADLRRQSGAVGGGQVALQHGADGVLVLPGHLSVYGVGVGFVALVHQRHLHTGAHVREAVEVAVLAVVPEEDGAAVGGEVAGVVTSARTRRGLGAPLPAARLRPFARLGIQAPAESSSLPTLYSPFAVRRRTPSPSGLPSLERLVEAEVSAVGPCDVEVRPDAVLREEDAGTAVPDSDGVLGRSEGREALGDLGGRDSRS